MSVEAPKPSFKENPKGAFGVEMRYNPDFLYYYLTHDNHRQTISLDNNLISITEDGYDIFRLATITLTSDLKVKSQPDWPDRSTKIVTATAGLWNDRDRNYYFKIPALMDALQFQGIETDLKPLSDTERRYTHDGLWNYASGDFLVVKNANTPWALEINADYLPHGYIFLSPRVGTRYFAGIRIIFPYPEQLTDLRSPADIRKVIPQHAKIMEKVMRAIYQAEKKHLPAEKLVFTHKEPGPEEAKKYKVICSYCEMDYSIINGFDCPHCGASKPKFVESNHT